MIDRNELLAIAGLREMAQRLRNEFNMPGTAARIEESALVLETSLAAKSEPQGGEVVYRPHEGDCQGPGACEGCSRAVGCCFAGDRATVKCMASCPCPDPRDPANRGRIHPKLPPHPAPKPAEGEGLKGWQFRRIVNPSREGDRWEVYNPDGSGGIVTKHSITDWVVRDLLDVLAAAPKKGDGNG